MWTLIKREIEDHIMYYLVTWVGAVFVIALYLFQGYGYDNFADLEVGLPRIMYVVMWIPICFLSLCVSSFGCNQMQTDKTRKISSFLFMLATGRKQILFARLISGILFFVVPIATLALTNIIVLQLQPRLVPVNYHLLNNMFVTAVLINLACYAVGLQLGWSNKKNLPKLASITLSIILIGLIVIKGFGPQIWLLLAVVTAASLTLTWKKFISTPL